MVEEGRLTCTVLYLLILRQYNTTSVDYAYYDSVIQHLFDSVWRQIDTECTYNLLPKQHLRMLPISLVHCCCLGNRLHNSYIPPWGVVLCVGVGLWHQRVKRPTPQGGIYENNMLFLIFSHSLDNAVKLSIMCNKDLVATALSWFQLMSSQNIQLLWQSILTIKARVY